MVSLNLGLSVLIFVSFMIVYAIFTKFFWRPIIATIRDREDMIMSEIESTKHARKVAESKIVEQDELLLKAHHDADRILTEAKRNAERIRADIIETAKLETQAILQQSREQAEFEKGRLIEGLKQDLIGLTLLSTQKVLGRVVSEEENERVVQDVVSRLVER